MDTQYFPQFIRLTFPDAPFVPNEQLIEFGNDFKEYLEKEYKGKEEILAKIWDISPQSVIKHQMQNTIGHMNGYHAALVYKFTQFTSELEKQTNQ